MSLTDLGKRFERLLTLALPISVVCLASSFAQFAHYEYSRNSERAALQKFSEIVAGLRIDLDRFFRDTKKPKTTPSYEYHSTIISWKEPRFFKFVKSYDEALTAIKEAVEQQNTSISQQQLVPFLDSKKSPDQLILAASAKLRELDGTVRMGEMVVPVRPDVSVLGTKITFPLRAVGAIGYLASCLALILWFGTLRLTRRRELLGLLSTQFRGSPFPHLLNSTMTLLVSHPKPVKGRAATLNRVAHKISLGVVRSMVVILIALLTILPLLYTSLVLQFDLDNFEPSDQLLMPFWFLVLVGFVPIWQLLMFWMEEMYWLVLSPVRMLLLGRDVMVN